MTSLLSSTVATVLEPTERVCVEAAAGEYISPDHSTNVYGVLRTLRHQPVRAVLLSPRSISLSEVPQVARMVREFPGVPVVVVVSHHDSVSSERLLQLGASGVRTFIDLKRREGLQRLRDVVGHEESPVNARILGQLLPTLDDATSATRRFFEVLVWIAPSTPTARELAVRLRVGSSSFTSRFFRAELPSPKNYLCALRLVHAAALFEIPVLSISEIAHRLDYSSPQSFGRHVRALIGITAGEFRDRVSLDTAVTDFIARMIRPFRATFQTFNPF